MEIQTAKCKWLIEEVCCCDKSEFLADYPNSNMCKSKKDCDFFEKEDGEL